jgi:hypothetical protein
MEPESQPLPKAPPLDEPETKSPDELPGAFALFGLSWTAFKLNLWAFVSGALLPIVILLLPVLILLAKAVNSNGGSSGSGSAALNVLAFALGLVGIISLLVFYVPYMYFLKLQSAKGVKMSFRSTFQQSRHYFWRLIGLLICRSLIVIGGLILLIVPGFFMWRRYMLAPFYLVDQDLGIKDSLEKSAADSQPFSGAIWGMIGVYVIIGVVGYIPLIGYVIGPVAGIVYCCAQSTRYLQIKKAKA